MEEKQRIVLEIAMAVVFVLLLVVGSIAVIRAARGSQIDVTNSYNTYNMYVESQDLGLYEKPHFVDGNYEMVRYDSSGVYTRLRTDEMLSYDDSGNLRTYNGVVGNNVNSYEVYVTNKEYVGGHFTVRFIFEDYYGRTNTERITKYISAREQKKFFIKDISPNEYKYDNWYYEVESLTKMPTREYNN